jgi:hypothetical protein
MTTNHIERLDPALIRPGRVDVIHQVGDASPGQIRRLFLKFFPVQNEEAGRFVTAMEGCTLRWATLCVVSMWYLPAAPNSPFSPSLLSVAWRAEPMTLHSYGPKPIARTHPLTLLPTAWRSSSRT